MKLGEGNVRLRVWLEVSEASMSRRTVREDVTSAALVVVPVALVAYLVAQVHLPDFKVFWEAGRAVISGASPYPHPNAAQLAQGHSFVYPAPAAVAMVPLALLPFNVAAALWTVLLVASVAGALLLLGVRDSRCYGAAFLTTWGANAIFSGSISPLLLLGLAALWRYRNRSLVAACLAAALLCLKVFLWPVLIWMVLSGRRRAAAESVLLSAVLCISAWALIGFDGLGSYPRLLADLASGEQAGSYSPLALLLGLGVKLTGARAIVVALGAFLLCAAAAVEHRNSRLAEVDSFTLCLVASLVLSPIVWPHYYLLLLVPVAITHNRFSLPWLLAIASLLSPGIHYGGPTAVVVALSVVAATLLAARVPPMTGRTRFAPPVAASRTMAASGES